MHGEAATAFLLFLWATAACSPQGTTSGNQPQEETVEIAKLSPPIYPPIARQTRVSGEVEVELQIRQDGSVVSTVVVRGQPLLVQAALDSARRSQYVCNACGEEPRSYRLLYTFDLGPTMTCEGDPSHKADPEEMPYPRLTQSQNHVTLVDRPWVTCDVAGTIGNGRRRSAKCLYLWRCERPRVVFYY